MRWRDSMGGVVRVGTVSSGTGSTVAITGKAFGVRG